VGAAAPAAGLRQWRRGIDLQFAGQRTARAVYAQGETDHVFTPQGATQILAIDLLAHAGEARPKAGA
jgi:3-methylcrotonyl-CoA carboxylase alpha subunit